MDNPRFWRAFAGWVVLGHIALWVLAELTGWVYDTGFISRLSLDALILAGLGWWQSGRVEVKQSEDADVQDVLDVLTDEGRE